jgi:hypothetical protein
MDKVLYEAILNAEVENALRQTCICLKDERWEPLQETWMRLLNEFGERIQNASMGSLFYVLMKELYELIHGKELFVKKALGLTTQFLMLYSRPIMRSIHSAHIPFRRPTLAKLRSAVIDYFPSDAHLTQSGRMKFKRFLPSEPDEAMFAERIIVGLLQLCESATPPEELRKALEYLVRKKITLTSAPTLRTLEGLPRFPQGETVDDLVPYLWMIFKIIKPLSYDTMIEDLYYYDYKSSYKPYRVGFLYMMAFLSESSATETKPIWSPVEQRVLNSVLERSKDLWKEIQMEDKRSTEETESPLFFIPKKEESEPEEEPLYKPEPKPEPKNESKIKRVVLGKNRGEMLNNKVKERKGDKHRRRHTNETQKVIEFRRRPSGGSLAGGSLAGGSLAGGSLAGGSLAGAESPLRTESPLLTKESVEWESAEEEESNSIENIKKTEIKVPTWMTDEFPCRSNSGNRRVYLGETRSRIQDHSRETHHR